MRSLILALALASLAGCTTEEEPVANRFDRSAAELANKARELEAEVENQVSAVEAEMQNEIDAISNQANLTAATDGNVANSAR